MIKFFRKIRQQLLTENKFTKYLLYAIGEIVLVVIGILIALQINNNNQAKQREIEVRELLTQIQNELAINIQSADEKLRDFCKTDSLIYAVLNDKVNRTDYEVTPDNKLIDVLNLAQLINEYSEFIIIDNGYLSLIENSGNFPMKYKPLLQPLTDLYENDKKWVYDYNGLIKENVFDNINYWKFNKKWYSNLSFHNQIDEEAIDFFLSDPYYKNQVAQYSEISIVQLRFITKFRMNAKNTFNAITTILGNEEVIKEKKYPFIIKVDDYKNWYGTYIWNEQNGEHGEYEVFFKDNALFEKSNDSLVKEIIPLSYKLYCSGLNGIFSRFKIDEKGEVLGGYWHWGRYAGEFQKID